MREQRTSVTSVILQQRLSPAPSQRVKTEKLGQGLGCLWVTKVRVEINVTENEAEKF